MVSQLAKHLVERGHKVTVATGLPNQPHGQRYAGYEWTAYKKEELHDVTVLRVGHFLTSRRDVLTRGSMWASQAVAMTVAGALAQAPDIVVNYGPPLLGSVLSSLLKKHFGAKLVSVVYDIYPDIAIETQRLKNPVLIAAAKQLETLSYRVADKILVLSEGFRRELLVRNVPSQKIEVIPVWLDAQEIYPSNRDNAWRHHHNIGLEQFVVLYAGTLGVVSGAEMLVDVAQEFLNDSRVLFLFVGEGETKDVLEQNARTRGLTNMRFLPFQDRRVLNDVQATADVALVTLAQGRGRTSVPSKVVAYMAAGRPVLASVDADCDTARAILAAGCGAIISPEAPQGLAAKLRDWMHDVKIRQDMGASGRQYFENHYSKESCLARYAGMLESL